MRFDRERGYAPMAASLDWDAPWAGISPYDRSVAPPAITTPEVRFGPAVRVMSAGCTTCPGSTEVGRMGMRDGLQGLGAVPAGGYVGGIGRRVGVGAIGRYHGPPHRSGARMRHAMTFAALNGFGSTETDICTALSAGASLATLAATHCRDIHDAGQKLACQITFTLMASGIATGCGAVTAAAAREAQRQAVAAQAQLDAGNAAAAQAALDAAHSAQYMTSQPKAASPVVKTAAVGIGIAGALWLASKFLL